LFCSNVGLLPVLNVARQHRCCHCKLVAQTPLWDNTSGLLWLSNMFRLAGSARAGFFVELAAVLLILAAPASGRLLEKGSLEQPALATKSVFSDNTICLRRYCVNPLFPALRLHQKNALQVNENKSWECVQSYKQWHDAEFCGRVIAGYQFALPALGPGDPYKSLEDRMAEQKQEAVHAYIAHIAGMGHDFWDYTRPWEHDECIQSVWKMACYTHFPRCNQLQTGKYLRPCASSCQHYLDACRVECCDEGSQCVFEHREVYSDGTVVTDDGYTPHTAPSPLCTGAAASWRSVSGLVILGAWTFLGLLN